MHREISHTDSAFAPQRNLALYLLTGLLGLLIFIDGWPRLVELFGWRGLPTWPNQIDRFPIAMIAAVIGGARILFTSLEGLLEGRVGADIALAVAVIAALLLNDEK